ncbi:MAG: hypothetical protein SLAVMIC_00700 [uncultured marine phage]|uniref:Lipoprotein n=1 Tax=uncultured marine phage TaxID=707152 RepID=A0A8D9CEM7_9VIRU|nr:MAG: hypothetical protein SLAVMIC_00700 [uncultured marine phage]
MRNLIKLLTITLVSFVLIGCNTVKTTMFQTYEWKAEKNDYWTDGNTYEKKIKFHLSSEEVSFKLDQKYTMKVISVSESEDENGDVVIYDCIMDGQPFRVVHYVDMNTILMYEQMMDEGRFETFVIFGN